MSEIDNIVDSLNDPFFIFDYPTDKAIRWNSSFCEISGYSDAEITDLPVLQSYFDPHDIEKAKQFIESITDIGKGKVELGLICKNGDPIPMEYNVTLIKDEKGAPASIISIGRDLSDRNSYKKQIEDNALNLQLALQAAHMGTWDWDIPGDIVTWSPETLEIFRVGEGQFDGHFTGYVDFIAPEELEDVKRKVNLFLSNPKENGIIQYSHKIQRGDGSFGWVEIRGTLFLDQELKPARLRGICTDITETRKMEERLQQAQKMEVVGQLAAGIAHDFNNILGGIIGYSELLLDECPVDSAMHKGLSSILQNGERAKQLVQQILTFSRKTPLTNKPMLLEPVIKEVEELIRSTFPATIDIQFHYDKKSLPVKANPIKIHEVVLNLCTNASQAMNEKGQLKIYYNYVIISEDIEGYLGTIKKGTYGVISITDNGPGMSTETISHIFEPFYTTKGVGKGTGLGLAVVFGIVKNHHGNILVESEINRGTTFKIYLPVTKELPRNAEDPSEIIPRGNERILVVDDDSVLKKMLTTMISSLGYEVTATLSSQEALEWIKKDPPYFDLVITDQTMPGLTGIELSKEILTIRSTLPIILCTGYSSVINEDLVFNAGIKGFMMKPVRRNELAQKIRVLLDRK